MRDIKPQGTEESTTQDNDTASETDKTTLALRARKNNNETSAKSTLTNQETHYAICLRAQRGFENQGLRAGRKRQTGRGQYFLWAFMFFGPRLFCGP